MIRLFIIICLLIRFSIPVNAQEGGFSSIKSSLSVLSMPNRYQYPSQQLSSSRESSNFPWIVYIDRPNVVSYTDPKKSSELKHLTYLDSFYVLQELNEMCELIHFSKKIILFKNKITNNSEVDYIGWVDRKQLLLHESSIVHLKSKDAIKYISILNGTKLFSGLLNTIKNNQIPVYKDPDLLSPFEYNNIGFQDIVYVYKEENNAYLLGKRSYLTPSTVINILVGWVDKRFIQEWGTRLCIEPNVVRNNDTSHTIVFPAKNHALHFSSNINSGIPTKSTDCLFHEPLWKRHPVFSTESVLLNQQPYTIYHTGTIIRPFSFDKAFVYTTEGNKIDYSMLCTMKESAAITNVLFVMNIDDDITAYYSELVTIFQGLDIYFSHLSPDLLSFHLINSNVSSGNNILSRGSYAEILPALIGLTKASMQFKQAASSSGILNGLSGACRFLKNHTNETNIVVLLSSRGDAATADLVYKSKTELLVKELASCNAKVLFLQPYASNISTYASFVPQAKNIMTKYADRSIAIKNYYQVKSTGVSYSNVFTSIEASGANLYCLDYPAHASSQGFILFPTIGSTIPAAPVAIALDSLFMQSALEHQMRISAIEQAFNSPAVFQSYTNTYFERYYSMYAATPRNLDVAFKNINRPYFSEGYSICPDDPHTGISYYSQYLLLSEWEYASLSHLFKQLHIAEYLKSPTDAGKMNVQAAFTSTLKAYAELQRGYYSQANLADFFYISCGYKSRSAHLGKILTNRLFDAHVLPDAAMYDLFTGIQTRLTAFYMLEQDASRSFVSNGVRYYWVDESMLP